MASKLTPQMFEEWDQFVRQNETNSKTLNVQDMIDTILTDTLNNSKDASDSNCISMKKANENIETIMKQLLQYQQLIAEKLQLLEQNNQNIASEYQLNMKLPNEALENTCNELQNLEERFSKVSTSAVLMGDQLAALDVERLRVLETDELMQIVISLNDPQNQKSSKHFLNMLQDPTKIEEAAKIVKKLIEISGDLSSDTLRTAVAAIENASQTIENQLLENFTAAQEMNDLPKLKQLALSIVAFSDYEKLADRFVWNVLIDELKISNISQQMSYRPSLNPTHDLELLFEKIKSICEDQFPNIEEIFLSNACTIVREILIERLFSDPVFGIVAHLDRFLCIPIVDDQDKSTEKHLQLSEYVQLLQRSYQKTCQLTKNITSLDNARLHSLQNKQIASKTAETIRPFLQLQLHSLFGSHRQPYFTSELSLLQFNFEKIFANIEFPPAIPTQKQFSTKQKQNTDSVNPKNGSVHVEKESVTEFSQKYYEKLKIIVQNGEIAKQYIAYLADAIARCEIILDDSELQNELITKAFTKFCIAFGEEFVIKIGKLMQQLLREPIITYSSTARYFELLKYLLEQHDALDDTFEKIVFTRQQHSPTQLTICFEYKHSFSEKLEQLIEESMQSCLQIIEKQLQSMLSLQEKSDFIHSVANTSLTCSKTCKRCVDYVEPIVSSILGSVGNENCEQLLHQLSQLFKKLLLQHILRYKFDPDGACTLLRDIDEYRTIFNCFPNPEIQQLFQQLQEIANIFALPSENIRNFIRDSQLIAFSKAQLLEIIKRRWDAKLILDKLNL